MAMLQIGGDILPGKIQHGAYDGQSVGPGGDGEHTVNAGGTAAEVKKGRFLLVVPVVGQSHESPRVTGGPFQKRGLPGFPGRFFNGYSAGMGHTADIDAFPDTGNTQGGGVTEHKHFLFLRFRTQLVIYMACNQIASRHAGQQGKQSHGVPPPLIPARTGRPERRSSADWLSKWSGVNMVLLRVNQEKEIKGSLQIKTPFSGKETGLENC